MEYTKEQSRIAYRDSGHIITDATAGSGKTTTIIYALKRARKIGIAPARTLVITSTESALARLLNDPYFKSPDIQPTTFERIALSIVDQFEGVGLLESSVRLSDHGVAPYIRDAIDAAALANGSARRSEEFTIDHTYVSSLMEQFSQFKNNMAMSDLARQEDDPDEVDKLSTVAPAVQLIFTEYESLRQRANVRTREDMLYDLVRKLEEAPESMQEIAGRYALILVDEFHDISEAQLRLLKALAGGGARVVVLGDADQCINTALGADPTVMQYRFAEGYAGSHRMPLTETFRFGPHLAGMINALLRRREGGAGKLCISRQRRKTDIDLRYYQDDCAAHVADDLLKWEASGNPIGDAAILVREFAHSIAIESKLIEKKIPYEVLGGAPFFERTEVLSLRGLLHLALDNLDSVSDVKVRRKIAQALLLFPSLGLDEGQVKDGADAVASDPQLMSGYAEHAFRMATKDAGGNVEQWKKIKFEAMTGTRDFLRENAQALDAGSLLEQAVERLHIYREIKTLYVRPEKIYSGCLTVSEFIRFAKRTGLSAADFLKLIREFEMGMAAKSNFKQTEFVKLTTIHYAKGHQWEHVIIPNLERGMLPQKGQDTDNERRILYVAMSRARSRLTLYAPEDEHLHNWISHRTASSAVDRRASSFLFDIDYRKAKTDGDADLKALGGPIYFGPVELKVPYAESGEAGRLGAKFNGRRKVWYVPAGERLEPFEKWH
ncbi:MAG: ATP-dependent helicase [Pseudomonadota bacterium]